MPRACWQRETHGNSVYYPLEIVSIPVNTTVSLKKLNQFLRAPASPQPPWPQVVPSAPDKHVVQHCQALNQTVQICVHSRDTICMDILSAIHLPYL